MSSIKTLKPLNRHITIVPHFTKKKETDVLLPEGYKQQESRFVKATIVDVASDCTETLRHARYTGQGGCEVVVDRSMIEEVEIGERTHYVVLENYVLGIYRRPDEG